MTLLIESIFPIMDDEEKLRILQMSSPRYRERLREVTIRQLEHTEDEQTVKDRRDLLGSIDDAERGALNRTGNDRLFSK